MVLRCLAHIPGAQIWAYRQLLLCYTWTGKPAQSWHVASTAPRLVMADSRFRLQAASAGKECAAAEALPLALDAQAHAVTHRRPRDAAWATLCLSLSLRWTGDLQRAEEEANRLADGLDALAAPVWRAWGHFELGALATLRDDAVTGVAEMRAAREVFEAAGAQDFVFDALCGELAAQRQVDPTGAYSIYQQAATLLSNGNRKSRFTRDALVPRERGLFTGAAVR